MQVREDQHRLFQLLCQSKQPWDVQELAQQAGMDQPMAMGTVTFAQHEGWVTVSEIERLELIASDDANARVCSELPERQFIYVLQKYGKMALQEVAQEAQKLGLQVNEIIKWGTQRGWLQKQGRELVVSEAGKKITPQLHDDDEKMFRLICDANWRKEKLPEAKGEARIFLDQLPALGIDPERVRELLKNRAELAKIKSRTQRKVTLTDKGRAAIASLSVACEEKNQLTSEDILSGNWKKISLRPYDVTLAAELKHVSKIHPLQKIIQEARQAFLQMGFTEVVSPQAEVSFWDFDALFQPQDHPSRDMQDTFYLKRPKEGPLPDAGLVEKVRQTHQNGGTTGSAGWGYQWKPQEARKMVMRTHTTATTVRALAADPKPPRKVFCVGRVFRNETIDFKHLPEFHQVDGIIIDNSASFCALLGTLREFYRKMGFSEVKFKPSFFPYTEPSADVLVWMPQKKTWLEFGGCGVFRPEVTEPLGCTVPVLAWGLGLERLAMMRYDLNDIRVLYGSDLDWLQEVSLCQ
jgi:phenylalanyl-tRNA synthetase alpha chain